MTKSLKQQFVSSSSSSSSSPPSSIFRVVMIMVPLVLIPVIITGVVSSRGASSSQFELHGTVGQSREQALSVSTISNHSSSLPMHTAATVFLPQQEERLRAAYAHDEDKLFKQSSVTNTTAQFLDTNYVPMQNITYVGSKGQEDEVIANDGLKIEREKQSKLEKVEAGLARARAAIREATHGRNRTSPLYDQDYVPKGPIYRNSHAFHRSYLEMEKVFKIYVYPEGEPPLFHDGPCKSIYSTEGRFIHDMELETRFRTIDHHTAHMFFLPFSVTKMVRHLYVDNSFDTSEVKRAAIDYIGTVARKYTYWNRSLGADHFILSCHDWGPITTKAIPYLYKNSVRVLCNANTSEGFNPTKDASLPEINLVTGEITGLTGGPSPSRRSILGFFAGGCHGHIRRVLLKQWKNKDQDLQVYEYLPQHISYKGMMKKSRFCLCPSGYEVASPRIVEAIYAECVPVIISEHYVLPFSEVLDWKSFSVSVQVKDIPNLKSILNGISTRQYLRMQRRVKQVQRHFVFNRPAKRYDLFHMILHSVWLRRLNVRVGQMPRKNITIH